MDSERLVIESVREDGSKFRPGDWIERISSILASFGPDHRLHYAKSVQPCVIQGQKCLVVEKNLHETNPEVYDYIMRFAEENSLRIQPDRRQKEVPVEEDRRQQ